MDIVKVVRVVRHTVKEFFKVAVNKVEVLREVIRAILNDTLIFIDLFEKFADVNLWILFRFLSLFLLQIYQVSEI